GQASPAARLWARMARAAWQADDPTRSLALCRQGLSVLGETPESDGLAYLIHETGRACYFNQIFPEARTLCQRALDLGRRLALVEVQAEALATLGILPGEGPDAHFRYLTESVALAEAADLPATASRGLNNLANAARELGRPAQEILDLLQRAREHNRRIGHVADELKFVCSLALTRAQVGDLAGAAALRRESQDLAAQLPPSEGTLALFELADTFMRFVTGEFEAALSLAEAGEARARAQEQRDMIDEYATLRARIYNFQGDLPAAEAAARTALAAVGGGERSVGGYGVLALLLAEQGRRAEARAALDQARQERGPTPNQIFESLLATAEAALADTAGQAEAGWGQVEAALAELEQAGWRWSYAVLLLEAAEVEAHSPLRDPERIRRRLRQARSRMEALGLPRYVALVDQRLRALEPG
ncbi:MAG: hypothetical protein JNK29_03975, partial [Anaerolineales bacterium]|nr:hypothetical protein [Anaerolineales bacterium]